MAERRGYFTEDGQEGITPTPESVCPTTGNNYDVESSAYGFSNPKRSDSNPWSVHVDGFGDPADIQHSRRAPTWSKIHAAAAIIPLVASGLTHEGRRWLDWYYGMPTNEQRRHADLLATAVTRRKYGKETGQLTALEAQIVLVNVRERLRSPLTGGHRDR
jgi:hypothetical protein